jgi:hypothetical protein
VSARFFSFFLSLALAIGVVGLPPRSADAQVDPHYFRETRYRIDDDRFWNFFLRRGGIETFGFPISNTFTLLGTPVQIFQRQVMQLQPDGSVGMLNLLDDDIMPYTKINGSVFPGIDKTLLKNAPGVGQKDYHARALQYVRESAPDVWQGVRVNSKSGACRRRSRPRTRPMAASSTSASSAGSCTTTAPATAPRACCSANTSRRS